MYYLDNNNKNYCIILKQQIHASNLINRYFKAVQLKVEKLFSYGDVQIAFSK